ncbi:MAG: hypothetical protein RLZ81_2846 [Pseudomonadota bacterium]|jgi:hypothetical protein
MSLDANHGRARLRSVVTGALVTAIIGLISACAGMPVPLQPDLMFGPYKDLSIAADADLPLASSRVSGERLPLVGLGGSDMVDRSVVVSLAFASGECGEERWGSLDAGRVARANVPAFDRAGVGYIISTGGEGGVFTCATDAGMERFIARYQSAQLRGIDFDIEASQTEEMITSLVRRAKTAQQRYPHLRFSFTLATFAAIDGSGASLNATGERVMRAIKAVDMERFVINLMVMNYGPATAANCVVREGRCDMSASAAQAVRNLHLRHHIPLDRIGLTAMIGVNDVTDNVFSVDDARSVARYARQSRLAGLHYWSLDRDTPCPDAQVKVSATCSSLNQVPPTAFFQAFRQGL